MIDRGRSSGTRRLKNSEDIKEELVGLLLDHELEHMESKWPRPTVQSPIVY